MAKVIFRKYKQGGEIIALFPEELWSANNHTISSYMHVGQHGAADYDVVIGATVPANVAEYADLLAELRAIGYADLRVMRKCRPNFSKLIANFENILQIHYDKTKEPLS